MTMAHRARLAGLLTLGLVAAGCSQGGNSSTYDITESQGTDEGSPASVKLDGVPDLWATAATGLATPWGIDFLPDERAIVTERDSGRVLIVPAPTGKGAKPGEPIVAGKIPGVVAAGESGLLGVAVSPDFSSDHLLYFYVCTKKDNRVVRATLEDDALGEPEPVLTGIPTGPRHDGGGLLFGDDGSLYVSTGETGRADLAQQRGNLAGKILRITTDGEPAKGNPFKGSPVWSYGHRNVEGMTLDEQGHLWASEFGDQIADEINRIRPGDNYGWPLFEGPRHGPRMVAPDVTRPPQDASWSGIAYSAGVLWVAGLRGERLYRIRVSAGAASDPRPYFEGKYGRLRAAAIAPDGRLWVGTSNKDGRGKPGESDDRLLVFTP